MTGKIPVVVIVGGGFGGLAAAKALRRAPVNVLLIDKSNHHVFQALLYRVATSVLAPGQISATLRGVLAKLENTSVMFGGVTAVDSVTRQVIVDAGDKEGFPKVEEIIHNAYDCSLRFTRNLVHDVAASIKRSTLPELADLASERETGKMSK